MNECSFIHSFIECECECECENDENDENGRYNPNYPSPAIAYPGNGLSAQSYTCDPCAGIYTILIISSTYQLINSSTYQLINSSIYFYNICMYTGGTPISCNTPTGPGMILIIHYSSLIIDN